VDAVEDGSEDEAPAKKPAKKAGKAAESKAKTAPKKRAKKVLNCPYPASRFSYCGCSRNLKMRRTTRPKMTRRRLARSARYLFPTTALPPNLILRISETSVQDSETPGEESQGVEEEQGNRGRRRRVNCLQSAAPLACPLSTLVSFVNTVSFTRCFHNVYQFSVCHVRSRHAPPTLTISRLFI
jgi:hypothetical protein